MILSRLAATCLFISATRVCPAASAAVMSCERGLPLGVVLGEEFRCRDEHRAGQAGVGVRAGLDHRELAVPVGQCLGGAATAVFCPGGLAERPVRADADGLPGGSDLAGFVPVLADGLVRQPGVVRRHVRRVVVEDLLHHMLGDVPVDQRCSQRVAPLVRGQVDGLAVLVADVAAFQPAA